MTYPRTNLKTISVNFGHGCYASGCQVNTNAINCLERLISEMTCYVSGGTLNRASSNVSFGWNVCASDASSPCGRGI